MQPRRVDKYTCRGHKCEKIKEVLAKNNYYENLKWGIQDNRAIAAYPQPTLHYHFIFDSLCALSLTPQDTTRANTKLSMII
jgi:hypothetical protein